MNNDNKPTAHTTFIKLSGLERGGDNSLSWSSCTVGRGCRKHANCGEICDCAVKVLTKKYSCSIASIKFLRALSLRPIKIDCQLLVTTRML